MSIYNDAKDDPDGRGLARALARLERLARPKSTAGQVPDTTPPAVDIPPTALSRATALRSRDGR